MTSINLTAPGGKQFPFETDPQMLYWWEKIWRHGEYDIPTHKPIRTIVDIGGCHGAFAVWAAARWQPDTIHCYEPNPLSFDKLVRNTSHLPCVRAYERAVLDLEAGPELVLQSSASNPGAASLHFQLGEAYPDVTEYRVKVIPALELPDCDLLKLDCEGSELRVLSECLFHNDRKNPYVVMLEYHAADIAFTVQQRMTELGYRLFSCVPAADIKNGLEHVGVMKWRYDK